MSEPTPVPINARFGDDFVTQLVLVISTDTMADVAEKVAYHVVGRRLPPRDAPMVVTYRNRRLPSDLTVEAAGIGALQNVNVDWADAAVATVSGGSR